MIYNDDPEHYRKGTSPIAMGKGVYDMMDVSYKHGYTEKNTILEVLNPNDLDSKWRIYRKVKK